MAVKGSRIPLVANSPGNMVITVKSLDGENYKYFIANKTTPLEKLMRAYCHMSRLSMRAVTFVFSGNPVTVNDTPELLGIEDGALLELVNAHVPVIVTPEELATNRIMIDLLFMNNRAPFSFFILRTTPVNNILRHHYRRTGIGRQAQRLRYQGVLVENDDTPESLMMEDGVTVIICYAQIAG